MVILYFPKAEAKIVSAYYDDQKLWFASFRGINWHGITFYTLWWFKLARTWIQVTGLHKGDKEAITWHIFYRKSILRITRSFCISPRRKPILSRPEGSWHHPE